ACGKNDDDKGSGGSGGGKKITIGIKVDQPGLGQKLPSGEYAGFDVDVARYVAKALGYKTNQIVWKEA
ncbi:transporter substrate-binding domain-containing protein, partial [Streptomyces sp. SID11233]|nr:transporter substrate-binding domain-containing protein [Streptomyces sp. SID11233]